MRIVQTYCNIKKTKPDDFFIKLALLSSKSIRLQNPDKFVLYTDCPEYFKDMPYDDIVTVDYFDWNWDKRYWNIPKLKTYTLQKEPFIHIDLDFVLTRSFSIDPRCEFITENVRTIDKHKESPYRHLKQELSCGKVLCSGAFGGACTKAYDLFDELYEKAKVECAEGVNQDVVFDDLFSIEEHWMYRRVVDELKLNVYSLSPCMFIHYGGYNKKSKYTNHVDYLLRKMC